MGDSSNKKFARPSGRFGKGKIYIVLLLAAAGGGGAFLWRHDFVASAKPVAGSLPIAVPVTATIATTRDLPIERSGIGTVVALSSVDVKARVDGQVQSLGFKEGQAVKAGDLIAQIDPRVFQAQLAQAGAALQRDLAQLENAQQQQSRAVRLAGTGSGTAQAVDAAKALVAVGQAAIAGDQAAIDTAKLNLDFATVAAPVGGRVGLRQVNVGAIIRATDATGIVTITQMQPISVQFSLPQDELPAILAGQRQSQLPVAVDSRDGQHHLADGKLAVIDSQVDTTTGMIRLKAVFTNADQALWPGELVSARVRITTDPNATVVPSAAVQNGPNGQFVFVIKSDSTVTVQPVTCGPAVENYTALLSGLKKGEKVVLTGQSRLTEGTLVAASEAASMPALVSTRGAL